MAGGDYFTGGGDFTGGGGGGGGRFTFTPDRTRFACILSVKVFQCSGVGLTLPSFRSNW